ncbi:cytoplasmic 60S subunit biogenesis factor ZNF622 isoform X2 [Tamandua tetradactyla]|uniref:cytoplasmic 60S subunit biogenesis factor ZNF622 isoform X2 n=1 Tax=Tamandua tetradactyla TaxID=48850 RepID=UPI0040542D8F
MATYTCITCRVAFRDAELQRAHYKTDWHRYNLRRKVADMAPVTAEGFQERVRTQRAVAEQESKGTATYCTVCSKKFASFNAYENHLKSRRHVELEKKAVQAVNRKVEMMNEKNLEKGLGADSVDKDAMNAAIQQAIKAQPSMSPKKAPPAPMEESRSPADVGRATHDRDLAEKPPRLQWFEQQAKKLAKQQGQESEEEEDLDGDGEKVGVGKICLWCNEKGKSFYSTEAVQAHMNDKSHCKLFTDGDAALEFADFYDFRSSYPDHKEGEDTEEAEAFPSEKNVEFDDETMELILPSGARVGHRSLMRYYKQRFGLSRAVTVAKNQKAVGRVLQQYRALGWTGNTGATLTRERDMQYVQRMKSKWMLKTGMKNNATKQMHFRVQVRF